MDHRRQPKDSLSYSNLFNLESLMNFQVPRPDDDFDYYGNSSQDESRDGSVGNGMMSDRELSSVKKRRRSQISDCEDDDSYYGTRITEERYRSMLGEHIQKYKRRFKDSSSSPAPIQMGIPVPKGNKGLKSRKLGNEQQGRLYEMETSSEWLNDSNPQKSVNHHDADLAPECGTDRIMYEPPYLDIGDGITHRIPPIYDKLVSSLHLPSFSDFRVEEVYLRGTLDLGSLAEMMTRDKRLGPKGQAGMGDPHPQYESLQARLKALPTSNSAQKFSLKVFDIGLNSSIPEGAAGNIKRYILSEGGVLQVYYVKVLEKGDTYEIIERSLSKKQKVIKDPSVIEKEEMDKIGKVWANIVRRDMPRHHRIFSSFHQRQLGYAKRVSENCQREVKLKVSRSLKLMRGAAIRTRKLARDMLLFWKRIDKEMAEVRKKEEKEAAEALRREQELREAKRQQQRLNFLIQQTELYSHFMQNKSSSQPSEDLPVGEGEKKDKKAFLSSSDDETNEEEDPEEAELKEAAFKAAQEAVSKQKKITSEFDNEYLKLCEDAEPEAAQDVAGASSIDLHNPSTMPVTSTVQTPELFKGSLKEYQLKGLQWLVNCYEQGLNGILADEMGLGKTIQAMAFLAHLAEEKNIWGPFLVVAPASVLNNWADEISRFCPDLKTLPYWGGVNERQVLRKKITSKKLYRRDAGFHILITSYQLLVADGKYFKRVKWQYMVLDEAQAIKSSNSIRWKTLLGFNCRNRLLLTGTPIQNNMAELWALLHFIMPTLFDSHEQFNEWFSKGIENHAEHGGTLNEHQLNRLHSILKPFMLRRVKADVVSELTRKTEVTVHCKLSPRQQAFYQAIKNKISLAELFDSNHGHLSEKKILNLMNIVIQLRKVCNHPELFERNEGVTYLYFSEIPNSLLAPPFGELEDVHYSGGQNPITYSIPKLFYQEILRPRIRGGLNILFQLNVTLGILFANLVNYGTNKITGGWGWRVSLGLAGFPAGLLTLGALFVVETPNSLVERGLLKQGKSVLKRIRGTENVEPEFLELVEASRIAKEVKHPFRNLLKRRNRPQLIIAVALQIFQQFTGINAIMFYAPVLFNTLGFGNDAALYSAVITGAVNVLSTVVSIYSVDKVGRRLLLLQAGVQMFISQVAIAIILGIKVKDHSDDLHKGFAIFVVVLICTYVAAFAWSWGPLGWLIPSETFPLETRSAGQSLTVCTNLLFTFVIAQGFLSMLCHFKYGIFLFFSGWVLVMSFFVLFLLPETKNIPIEEMTERVWKQHWLWKRFMDDDDYHIEGNHGDGLKKNGHANGFDGVSQL